MMGFLAPLLRKLFAPRPEQPVDPPSAPIDPIARDIDAAVAEHGRVAAAATASYERALRDTMNDLFNRMGHHDDADG